MSNMFLLSQFLFDSHLYSNGSIEESSSFWQSVHCDTKEAVLATSQCIGTQSQEDQTCQRCEAAKND
jgi:hypothetical protein